MIVGHKKVIDSLKDLAKENVLSHGYIFSGPSMVGKSLVARFFANYLENGKFSEPELLIDAQVFSSPSGGTVGIDTVREIKQFLWQKPVKSPRRTAIIDGAERLTPEAQNALLKIAEEPPPSSLLILVTSDTESLLETLRSRLQVVYFSLVRKDEIADWLEKDLGTNKMEAEKLAKNSFGKPGFAMALKSDERLADSINTAEKFFKLAGETRSAFIKELIKPDDFALNNFLDSLILYLTLKPEKRNPLLWHKVLELKSRSANFGLNPRIQLENL